MGRKAKGSDEDWGEESTPNPQPVAPKQAAKPSPDDPRLAGLEKLSDEEKRRRLAMLDEHKERMELIKSQTLALLTHAASELERNNPQLVAFIREDERAKVLAEFGNGK